MICVSFVHFSIQVKIASDKSQLQCIIVLANNKSYCILTMLQVVVSFDETTTLEDLYKFLKVFIVDRYVSIFFISHHALTLKFTLLNNYVHYLGNLHNRLPFPGTPSCNSKHFYLRECLFDTSNFQHVRISI